MSRCWLALVDGRAEGADAAASAFTLDGRSAGTLAAWRRRGKPTREALRVDERRGVIVGATFTGVDVAEWLHAATIAIVGRIPVERLWDAVPAFPTRSEIWPKLLERRGAALAAESKAPVVLAA